MFFHNSRRVSATKCITLAMPSSFRRERLKPWFLLITSDIESGLEMVGVFRFSGSTRLLVLSDVVTGTDAAWTRFPAGSGPGWSKKGEEREPGDRGELVNVVSRNSSQRSIWVRSQCSSSIFDHDLYR